MEDKVLADAAAGGDQDAFALLVERYRVFIYSVAYKIALNEDDALDIAQNVFMRLAGKIGSFNGRGTFRAWVATITAHEAMSYLRRPVRRESATDPGRLEEISDARQSGSGSSRGVQSAGGNARDDLETAERRRAVVEAMEKLPAQQRAVFALHFVEDMRPAEIAGRLGIPTQQVRSQLYNAIDKIRLRIAGGRDKRS